MSEIGPAILLYNGKVIFFGAANSNGHGKTLLYTPPTQPTQKGTWAAGPDIPTVGGQVMVCNDCPATLLPNGKGIVHGRQFRGPIVGHTDYSSSNMIHRPTQLRGTHASNNATYPYAGSDYAGIYWSRMMLLPNGQGSVQCKLRQRAGLSAGRRPAGCVAPHHHIGHSTRRSNPDYYLVQGTQLNGLSQANIYGDDCYPATNYPLARLTNAATHQVLYCRTHDFSTMGVATGSSLQSCRFTPAGVPAGTYE